MMPYMFSMTITSFAARECVAASWVQSGFYICRWATCAFRYRFSLNAGGIEQLAQQGHMSNGPIGTESIH
jgi:hypothetical protein